MRKKQPAGTWRLIAAASIGNALEWFDLVVFGFVAPTVARAFFPHEDAVAGLLMTFGAFGLSYVARPVGALWLGGFADRHGRQRALTLSIALMCLGTLLIALTPTYAQIGLLAPCLLVVARLLQGLSAGGEFGAATALLIEHLPARRGFMGSWQVASQGASTVLASACGVLLDSVPVTSPAYEWAWRMPFVFGLLIAPIGLYIRNRLPLDDAPVTNQRLDLPLMQILREQKTAILYAIALMMGSTSASYVLVYLPTYVKSVLHAPAASGYWSTFGAGLLLTVLPPFVGSLSDRFGRLAVMMPSGLVLFVSSLPLFVLLGSNYSITLLIAVTLWVALWKAAYFGGLPAMLAERFPPEVRASGLNIVVSIGAPVFGGFAPVVLTALAACGVRSAPGVYLSAMAGVSVFAMLILKSRAGERDRERPPHRSQILFDVDRS